jgi:probable rRNA maturation factor
MAVRIIDRQEKTRIDRRAVRGLVLRILADRSPGADVAVLFVDDASIRALNHRYRGIDRPTDVLAFAMLEARGGEPAGGETDLGDVVVSVDRAAVQARRYKRSFEREILKLVAHGVLHLLGYEHERSGELRKMRLLENRYVREASEGARRSRRR